MPVAAAEESEWDAGKYSQPGRRRPAGLPEVSLQSSSLARTL